MKRTRATINVEVDLDPLPGWGHHAADWVAHLQRHLNDVAGHYNPQVTTAETPRADERATLSEAVEAAHAEIHRICRGGEERWRMTIPADPTRDSDLILTAALDDLTDRLAAAVARAEAAAAKVAAVEAALNVYRVPGGVSCGGAKVDAPGCFAADLAERVRAALGSATTEEVTEHVTDDSEESSDD